MKFTDIFTSDILGAVTAVSITDIVLGILFSFLLGLFIFYVYKKTYNGVMYSAGFGLTLVALSMICSMLILAVSSNVILSLGMVGALSIVRFRTAIKEPLDIAFLFWAIAVGIIVATGMFPLAVFGSAGIGAMLLIFANKSGKENPYLLVIRLENSDLEDSVMEQIHQNVQKDRVKSKTFDGEGTEELTVEVFLKNGESAFVKEIHQLDGVKSLVMVSYNGEYMQ